MVLDPPASNMDSFHRRNKVLLSFTWKGLFCRRCCSSQFKTLTDRLYSFYKITQFSHLNNVPNPLAFNLYSSLTKDTLFLAFTFNWGYFAQRWCSLPMKTLRGRQYSFKMLTQFILLNNVLDPLACYINDSLPRGTVLLSFTWERLFCTKIMLETLENPEHLAVFLLKSKSILTPEQHARPSCF
jgi:hypothetical protein